MYIFRAIKIFILSLSATTVLSIAAVVAFLSSDMGKQKLKEGLNYYLDFEGVEYEIGAINSFLPLSINLDKVHFTQNGKPWLVIQRMELGVLVNQLLFHRKLEGE